MAPLDTLHRSASEAPTALRNPLTGKNPGLSGKLRDLLKDTANELTLINARIRVAVHKHTMNLRRNPVLICLLVLSILSLGWLDGRGMAHARPGVSVTEICADGVARTVLMTASGEILDEAVEGDGSRYACVDCPDCLPPVTLALADAPPSLFRADTRSRPTRHVRESHVLSPAHSLPPARAPPERT